MHANFNADIASGKSWYLSGIRLLSPHQGGVGYGRAFGPMSAHCSNSGAIWQSVRCVCISDPSDLAQSSNKATVPWALPHVRHVVSAFDWFAAWCAALAHIGAALVHIGTAQDARLVPMRALASVGLG